MVGAVGGLADLVPDIECGSTEYQDSSSQGDAILVTFDHSTSSASVCNALMVWGLVFPKFPLREMTGIVGLFCFGVAMAMRYPRGTALPAFNLGRLT